MKRNYLLIFIALIALSIGVGSLGAPVTRAQDPIAGSSAALLVNEPEVKDERVEKLTAFLKRHDSPITDWAEVFIREADIYTIDWRLVAAIAGVESTFGKHIPAGSYNAWGWGIPTGSASGIGFASWEDGIATVSYGLKTRYIDRGADTVEKMAPIYAPPSTTWAGKVLSLMDKIENFQNTDPTSLDLSL